MNSDDANRLHYDDEQLRLPRPLLPTTNPLGPCKHFHFLIVIRALHVSYSPIVVPRMLGCCEAPVAIEIAVVALVYASGLVSMMSNVRFSDVGCGEVPEIPEISFVDSNVKVADSDAEYPSTL